ncbi:hypothetical protein Mp_zg01480 [Marchantia polymorpha subsp. ruderalis]|uniref:HAT C-terminal dimerisation domain-containing protein n=2 Tax=Marchantia polymorpha TaxID=3197 RepID=A0A679DYC3_MARPO|nr:hypothetical protein MARPO_YB0042 [Marchantia polymorpha]BBN20791.1 hypothetical protein Mp_zg01480 [Marchantia polymorpha subsp. ruderalis]|eukprot:PTQ26101.1 hypothetical protein MARPO_YB0042 [Marchantia polymorpha]
MTPPMAFRRFGLAAHLYALVVVLLVGYAHALTHDGQILLRFKANLLNPEDVLPSWNKSDDTPCAWVGVRCNANTSRVTYLNIPYKRLSGSISAELGKLTQLRRLVLHENRLVGPIPLSIRNLTFLRTLYLRGNALSGNIPDELGELMNIEVLNTLRFMSSRRDFCAKVMDPYELDNESKEANLNALVAFVMDHQQAFNLVENETFRSLCRRLNPHYSLPSRQTLTRSLSDHFERALLQFRSTIDSIKGAIALTQDCWSSRVMRGYMVITVQWIDEEWKLQSVVLEFRYFPPPHNQHTTSDLILSVVKDYNMWSKIKAIISDSGGEMPPAMVIVRENLNDQYSLRLEDGFHIRCICHVINRAVYDATHFIKKEVQMLRQILKAVRGSVAIRVKFSELAVVLGVSKGRVEVPGLDMETRWNTMFTMIDQSFQYRGVFSALCNSEEFCDRLANMALSDMDWRVLKSCKDFLQSAYHCTVAASGRDYISLSLQPLIYKHLLTLCEKTRSGQLDTGFTTPIIKQAATAMELKLLKYSANLNCQASKMALLLDPRSSNASSETMELKDQLRFILTMDYGLCSEVQPSPTFGVFDLFAGEGDSAIENVAHTDEVDDFFMLTAKADRRVSDVLLWWKQHSNRFPTLSLMARDTLMIQGSSVASESAFSESGGFVCPDRSKLSDENIEMMMKLKSWNRLFRE